MQSALRSIATILIVMIQGSWAAGQSIPLDADPAFSDVGVIVTGPKVTMLKTSYGPTQIKCVFANDPNIGLFISFDQWTAKCIRDQKIRESREIIGRIKFAERQTTEDEINNRREIRRDGWKIYRNPVHDLASIHGLAVREIEGSSELRYDILSIKRIRTLGKRRLTIPVLGTKGRADLLDRDGEVIDSRELNCETKLNMQLTMIDDRGQRDYDVVPGYRDVSSIVYTPLVGCGPAKQ